MPFVPLVSDPLALELLVMNPGCRGLHCSSTSRDICWETCQDGINAGGVECDDGNDNDGDGCDEDCEVEDGYYCEGGDLYTADTCYEICGDAKNMGVNECDDGNTISGDGC